VYVLQQVSVCMCSHVSKCVCLFLYVFVGECVCRTIVEY